MGVFSTLNNLKDISLLPKFASIVGFTHEELERNFKPFLKEAAGQLRLDEKELLARIRDYYDGFSFDGQARLYNPFSTLNFFQDKEFQNYWMHSGSNTLIREMLKDKALMAEQFRGLEVSSDFAQYPGEIDQTPPEGFLYQAGYLTLRKDPETGSFMLDYPNFEVSAAMARLFVDNIFKSELNTHKASIELVNNIKNSNIPEIISNFIRFYSSITYDDHINKVKINMFLAMTKNKQSEVVQHLNNVLGQGFIEITKIIANEVNNILDSKLKGIITSNIESYIFKNSKKFNFFEFLNEKKWGKVKNLIDILLEASGQADLILAKARESFYRATLQSYLLGAGLKVVAELHNNLGRSDLIIEHESKRYVIELKVVEKFKEAETAAQNAIKQIVRKGYGALYCDPVLIGLAISEEKRNISACVFVKNNKIDKLAIKENLAIVLEQENSSCQAEAPGNQSRPRSPRP
jgi:hypothetical protein